MPACMSVCLCFYGGICRYGCLCLGTRLYKCLCVYLGGGVGSVCVCISGRGGCLCLYVYLSVFCLPLWLCLSVRVFIPLGMAVSVC